MTGILLTTSKTSIPFTRFLKEEVGVPVEPLLRQARLPTLLDEHENVYLPSHLLQDYRDRAAKQTGIEELGFLAGERFWHVPGTSPLSLQQSPTLKTALDQLHLHLGRESTNTSMWMNYQGEDKVWMCWRRGLVTDSPGSHQTSLFMNGLFIQFIRYWVGYDWSPETVLLPELVSFSETQKRVFRDAQFFPTWDIEGFCFPFRFLQRQASKSFLELLTSIRSVDSPARYPEEDFIRQLRRLLQVYLNDGYPHIELGAALAGCGTRTLQRRLKANGLTYTKLVDQARYQLASNALIRSDIPLIELALALGFSSQTNFTRAFHRFSGTTPKRFRQRYSKMGG